MTADDVRAMVAAHTAALCAMMRDGDSSGSVRLRNTLDARTPATEPPPATIRLEDYGFRLKS